jgi:tetratricopeptide (TPR) repeat protein
MDADTKRDLNLGREHYESGSFAEAEPLLRAVVAKQGGFADVHNMLGVIRYQRGDALEAAKFFERAVELNPRYNEAALNLAVAYNELGRYEEARERYDQASRGGTSTPAGADDLDDFVRGKIANLHGRLADAYLAVGLVSPAIDQLRLALGLCPHFADLHAKLGASLREAGMLDEALAELERACNDHPTYARAQIERGAALYAAKRLDEARAAWERALEIDPQSRTVKAYLSMVGD